MRCPLTFNENRAPAQVENYPPQTLASLASLLHKSLNFACIRLSGGGNPRSGMQRYRVTKQLGDGTYGSVLKAVNL